MQDQPDGSFPTRPMADWSEALDLRAIAAEYGTPVYLHHPETLRRAFAAYAALFGAAGVRYPVKANPSPLVLEAIAGWGGGADCASRHEVQAALAAGIPFARIHYNTPAPRLEDALWLLRQGATVVADDADFLATLAAHTSASELVGRVYVRVNPGQSSGYLAEAEHQRYTAHGDPRSQFGIPSEDVVALLQRTALPVTGLHVHVGTMMDNLEAFLDGLAFLHALAARIHADTSHRVRTLNLGGGLGLPHARAQRHPTIAAFADALRSRFLPGFAYEGEPGNSLVGDSFALLTRVVSLKHARGRTWGICDVGTDQLVKHTVAGWRHEIVDDAHRALPAEGPDALAGPLCFAGDVLLPQTRLDGVKRGDVLLLRHAGAYCESIASHFNGRFGPPTIVCAEGRPATVARRAEDAFFSLSSFVRPIGSAVRGDRVEDIPAARLGALSSVYMQQQARDDVYTLGEARRLRAGVYEFTVTVDAPAGFVGMPLAVRIAGDASIVAIGLELGWDAKAGAVLASRLTLAVEAPLPGQGSFPCRVSVSALAPVGKTGTAVGGCVRFELGDRPSVTGSAQVSAPTSAPVAKRDREGRDSYAP